jgi:hypothetical protein
MKFQASQSGPQLDPARVLACIAQTYAGRIPTGFVAIADDSGGNLFLLEVGSHDGGVWFWDHETGAVGRTRITSSLGEFIAAIASAV